jgi:hypothetical protein
VLEIHGPYADYEKALEAGYSRHGLGGDWAVRKIAPTNEVIYLYSAEVYVDLVVSVVASESDPELPGIDTSRYRLFLFDETGA